MSNHEALEAEKGLRIKTVEGILTGVRMELDKLRLSPADYVEEQRDIMSEIASGLSDGALQCARLS